MCSTNPVNGYKATGIIINRADVDWANCTVANGIITKLQLVSTKKGYKIFQPINKPFNGTNTELNVGTYANTFNHNVNFVLLGSDSADAPTIDNIANGEFIVILYRQGSTNCEVFGYYQGLTASAMTRDEYSEDTIGGWQITLSETASPASALYTTKAIADSLTA